MAKVVPFRRPPAAPSFPTSAAGVYQARIRLRYGASDPDAGLRFITDYLLPYLEAHPLFLDLKWIGEGFPLPEKIPARCSGSVGGAA